MIIPILKCVGSPVDIYVEVIGSRERLWQWVIISVFVIVILSPKWHL